MHDALARIVKPEQPETMPAGILLQCRDHARDGGIGDRPTAPARGDVVIGHAEGQLRLRHALAPLGQFAERVVGALMHEMPIDEEQRRAILAGMDFMRLPDLVEQGQWGTHSAASPLCIDDLPAALIPCCGVVTGNQRRAPGSPTRSSVISRR